MMHLREYIWGRMLSLMQQPHITSVVGTENFTYELPLRGPNLSDFIYMDGPNSGHFRYSLPFIGSRLVMGLPARCVFHTEWEYMGTGNYYIKRAWVDVKGYGRLDCHIPLADRVFSYIFIENEVNFLKQAMTLATEMIYVPIKQARLDQKNKVAEKRRFFIDFMERAASNPEIKKKFAPLLNQNEFQRALTREELEQLRQYLAAKAETEPIPPWQNERIPHRPNKQQKNVEGGGEDEQDKMKQQKQKQQQQQQQQQQKEITLEQLFDPRSPMTEAQKQEIIQQMQHIQQQQQQQREQKEQQSQRKRKQKEDDIV